MPQEPYAYLIDIVERRFFHGLDNRDLDLALGCFQPDAVLTEVASSSRFTGRDTEIRGVLKRFLAAHARIWHGNFVHTADPDTQSVCSQYSLEVEPAGAGRVLRYENANRFYLVNGLFQNVYVYMSGENLLK